MAIRSFSRLVHGQVLCASASVKIRTEGYPDRPDQGVIYAKRNAEQIDNRNDRDTSDRESAFFAFHLAQPLL